MIREKRVHIHETTFFYSFTYVYKFVFPAHILIFFSLSLSSLLVYMHNTGRGWLSCIFLLDDKSTRMCSAPPPHNFFYHHYVIFYRKWKTFIRLLIRAFQLFFTMFFFIFQGRENRRRIMFLTFVLSEYNLGFFFWKFTSCYSRMDEYTIYTCSAYTRQDEHDGHKSGLFSFTLHSLEKKCRALPCMSRVNEELSHKNQLYFSPFFKLSPLFWNPLRFHWKWVVRWK